MQALYFYKLFTNKFRYVNSIDVFSLYYETLALMSSVKLRIHQIRKGAENLHL